MEELRKKIINEIINQLATSSNTKNNQLTDIETDLINHNYVNLDKLINNNYQELQYSENFKIFVTKLVNHQIIPQSYLEIISNLNYQETLIENENFNFISSKPLNIEIKDYNKIIKNNLIETEDEFLFLESENLKEKKEKMLKLQLSYLDNATDFIQKLDKMEVENIYDTLLTLNDIRFIQHSISKLSSKTLNNLLIFIKEKLKENNHNSINIFIEEAIKKSLHQMS